ncbi:MAG: MT-A70 family methyltransferase [Bryobacteraceae bacterium]
MAGDTGGTGLIFPAHQFAELFPLIEGEEFLAFAEDIRANGVRDPIVLLGGAILDGRNRANALAHLAETGEVLGEGWGHRAGEPLSSDHLEDDYPWFRKFNRDVDGDPLAWVLSKNLKRRHLDESQRSMVAAKLADMGIGRPSSKKAFEPAPDHIPPIGGISAQAAAIMLNVGARSVERARSVLRDGAEDLKHAVEQGAVAVSTAEAISSLPKDEQAAIVAKGEKEILAAAKDIRARQRQVRFAEVNEKLARISEGNRDVDTSRRFPILYLDPASRFKSGFGDRSIENHYPTMEWPEIMALPIPQLATDVALMLCWSTVPQLANTLEAIKHWGFEYVSEWCWDKVDHGTGYWGFSQHEILLIAKRGAFPAPIPGTQPRSLYREKKTGHSAKPAWFAEQIERIWPDLPKVELFARETRPGWSTWGNQSESQAKEPEANVVEAQSGFDAMGSSRHVAGRTATTTSENLDVTGRRDAHPISDDIIDLPDFLRLGDEGPTFTKGEAA